MIAVLATDVDDRDRSAATRMLPVRNQQRPKYHSSLIVVYSSFFGAVPLGLYRFYLGFYSVPFPFFVIIFYAVISAYAH